MVEETAYIQKNELLTQAENYPFLREEGIKYLQALSGKIWTDYNIHDPGVTMLELLCYAITDLGYRSRFSMADLLTKPGEKAPDKTNSFYTAKEIFTTHPVTAEDYRRLLIERIPGLKNVWLEETDNEEDLVKQQGADTTYYHLRTPGYSVKIDEENHRLQLSDETDEADVKRLHVHGLYRVKMELDDWETMLADHELKIKIEQALSTVRVQGTPPIVLENTGREETNRLFERLVKRTLHRYRNLCEDFDTVAIMKDEVVSICADIEVTPATDINELIKKIYRLIYNYTSPSLNFYSLQEMLVRGRSVEEIFEGTVPLKGFVDYEELRTRFSSQRTVMYTSDLINLIMDLEGVVAVKRLLLTSTDEQGNIISEGEKYCLHLSDTINRSFRFRHLTNQKKPANKINFFKANLPFKATEPGPGFVMKESKEPEIFTDDLPIPAGGNRGLDEYHLVQNEFPQVYYCGTEKMPVAEATPLRQQQRMQLKGYLVFFEQLLANYLAQLNNLPSLFSWNKPGNINTYRYQRLQELTASDETLIDFTGLEDVSSDYLAILNDPANNVDRRNRLLDSLLARFNEKFVDYSVFKYTHNNVSLSVDRQKELVKDKCSFLKNYAAVSANRSHGIDIYRRAWLTHLNNLSGLQRYMTAILGLNVYEDHYLAKVLRNPANGEAIPDPSGNPYYFDISNISFDRGFGLHMIEHILLRPVGVDVSQRDGLEFLSLCCCEDDKEPTAKDYCADPYSMRITVVLPGWLNLSQDMEFRKFVNTTIRNNTAAHIAIKICWIGMEQMFAYEEAYVRFLKMLKQREQIDFSIANDAAISEYNTALHAFVHVINNLKNVYPPATLHDCENSGRDVNGNLLYRTVILNRTTLGNTRPVGLNMIPYQKPYPVIVDDNPDRERAVRSAKGTMPSAAKAKKAPDAKLPVAAKKNKLKPTGKAAKLKTETSKSKPKPAGKAVKVKPETKKSKPKPTTKVKPETNKTRAKAKAGESKVKPINKKAKPAAKKITKAKTKKKAVPVKRKGVTVKKKK